MAKERCNTCVGSGKVMGGGMMLVECDDCDGRGKIFIDEKPEFKIDKESKHFKKAIEKIKALHPDITNEEAEKLFEEELSKINLKEENDDAITSSKKAKKTRQDN